MAENASQPANVLPPPELSTQAPTTFCPVGHSMVPITFTVMDACAHADGMLEIVATTLTAPAITSAATDREADFVERVAAIWLHQGMIIPLKQIAEFDATRERAGIVTGHWCGHGFQVLRSVTGTFNTVSDTSPDVKEYRYVVEHLLSARLKPSLNRPCPILRRLSGVDPTKPREVRRRGVCSRWGGRRPIPSGSSRMGTAGAQIDTVLVPTRSAHCAPHSTETI